MASTYSFSLLNDTKLKDTLNQRELRDCFMQWNLDNSTKVEKFNFSGGNVLRTNDDYLALIYQIFQNQDFLIKFNIFGNMQSIASNVDSQQIVYEALDCSVLSMGFFDCLDTVAPNGNIRGCYEERYHRVTVSDELRECLLNEESEHKDLFSLQSRRQFVYHLLRLLAVGGPMCQPDVKVKRYLDSVKTLYKALITVYKDTRSSEEIKVASRVYLVKKVKGMTLFSEESEDDLINGLYFVIDPILHQLIVLKYDYKPFW